MIETAFGVLVRCQTTGKDCYTSWSGTVAIRDPYLRAVVNLAQSDPSDCVKLGGPEMT